MDNIRNVIGCPVSGLTPNELFDAAAVAREFTRMFVANKAYTNLPRKFNVAITGCKENCSHPESQDIALTPATKAVDGAVINGFNVAVGGKMGSGGYRIASPLDVFVGPEEAAEICSQIVFIFRDHGFRESRAKARLAFLVDAWGVRKFRRELERRADRPLPSGGKDERLPKRADHIGILRQKQEGLNYVGLAVPVGRVNHEQMSEAARLSEAYGTGDVRITVDQNLIIPNVPDGKIGALTAEPLLRELRYDPSEIMRGLVSCTGMDYCHFALIETKELALKTARSLEKKLGKTQPVRIHWSGCPASCANHAVADIGLVGKNIKVNGNIAEAVDVFFGGSTGPDANLPVKILEDVPCEALPAALAGLIRHGAFRAMRQQLRKMSRMAVPVTPPPETKEPAGPVIRPDEIAEGSAKLVRTKGEEMAVFRSNGQLYGIQNICPHEGGQLCKGWLEGEEVVCPLHGYKFHLKTGACSTDPRLMVKVFKLVARGSVLAVEE
jgi:ferredoxin-nitrite reductase